MSLVLLLWLLLVVGNVDLLNQDNILVVRVSSWPALDNVDQ